MSNVPPEESRAKTVPLALEKLEEIAKVLKTRVGRLEEDLCKGLRPAPTAKEEGEPEVGIACPLEGQLMTVHRVLERVSDRLGNILGPLEV